MGYDKTDAELIQLLKDNPNELILITCLEVRGLRREVCDHAQKVQEHDRILLTLQETVDRWEIPEIKMVNYRKERQFWGVVVGVPSGLVLLIMELAKILNKW